MIVVVFPVPGGPYNNKCGNRFVSRILVNIFRFKGSNTISSKFLGLYFSTHGQHCSYCFVIVVVESHFKFVSVILCFHNMTFLAALC